MNLSQFETTNAAAAEAAARALGRLARRPVAVEMARVDLIPIFSASLRPARRGSVPGIYAPINGVPGAAILRFPPRAARALSERLSGGLPLKERPRAADATILLEVGNIIFGNYVAVLANELRAKIVLGVPRLTDGFGDALLERALARLSGGTRAGRLVKVRISLGGETVVGDLLVLLRAERVIDA